MNNSDHDTSNGVTNLSEQGGWKKLSSKQEYDNPWMSIVEDQVINPSGNPSIYGKVHFKNKAIAIIPVDNEGYTWLVGQYRYVLEAYSWEIPMGGGPHEEEPLNAAQRELQEETGLTAAHWHPILGTVHLSNCITDEEGVAYLARGLTMGATNFDETERLSIQRVPLSKAFDMAISGEISDAFSVLCLLKLKVLLDSGDIPAIGE